ncbi:MAG TPA: trimethylamine methyltransferase family protein [Thermoleophilia bacterium]|nr:trimethylamine methyltransferase family protein [Thermoleophilia bacterium]HQJ97464.1 trimethylamine methyltransferase family protein [Thermoleophilia bacterium]
MPGEIARPGQGPVTCPVDIWPDDAVEAIHVASLALLSRAGVRVESPTATEMMLAAGCTAAGDRVLVPEAVVKEALARCPERFVLAARDGEKSLVMDAEPAQTYVHNLGGARDVIDPRTGAGRRATMRDQVLASRVMHHLENQHQVTSLWQPDDVPSLLEPLYSYVVLAWETDKAIGGPGISHAFQAHYLTQMATVVTGADGTDGTYPVDLAFSPVSPLTLGREVTDALVAQARRGGAAIEILPCPAAGTTAPASVSAAVAQQNAEVLAGIVLTEAVAPGTPVYYGPRLSAVDPRSGVVVSGTPETGVASLAAILLARRYGLACDCYGPSTDSKVVDAQFGYERAVNALLGLAGRPRLLSGIGEIQAGVGSCLEVVLIDDEILNNAMYALTPRPWDADALDVDAMVDGVLSGRGFLGTRHTRRYLRSDCVTPLVGYRGGLSEWLAADRHGVLDLAEEKVAEVIAGPPVGLPDDVLGSLCTIIERAAREAGVDEWPDPRRLLDV